MEYISSSKRAWYLICCKPRQERVAQENLERQGFETYLPLMRQTRRRAHRRVTVIEPLFPRYLFIHLDAEKDNWSPIRSTIGVTSLVRFGTRPAQAPDTLINELQTQESPDGLHNHPNRSFRKGEKVCIEEGPLAGYEAIWLARNGKERAQILLEIMGKQTKTEIDENWLKRSET
jgi:transcriptional antiterminator RfaH